MQRRGVIGSSQAGPRRLKSGDGGWCPTPHEHRTVCCPVATLLSVVSCWAGAREGPRTSWLGRVVGLCGGGRAGYFRTLPFLIEGFPGTPLNVVRVIGFFGFWGGIGPGGAPEQAQRTVQYRQVCVRAKKGLR